MGVRGASGGQRWPDGGEKKKKKNGDEELKRARVLTATMLRTVIRNAVTARTLLKLHRQAKGAGREYGNVNSKEILDYYSATCPFFF